MSSGHNTNRGRNGGSGGNGGSNRRARRTLSHQRNPAAQSIFPNRADSAPASAPASMSEVSASLEPEESLPAVADRADPTIRRGEASDLPAEPVPPTPPVSSEVQAARDPAPTLNSIRAPFAPGHNHLPPAGNVRPAIPPAATDPAISSGRNFAPVPPQRREEGTSRLSEATWEPTPPKRASDDSGNEWSRSPTMPGRTSNTYRDGGSRQEQSPLGGTAFFEGRDVRGDIGELIDSLHEAFERDRGIASQGDSTRCGICYLHYFLGELQYREEEGYYVCASCARALSHTRILMVRRQQRL